MMAMFWARTALFTIGAAILVIVIGGVVALLPLWTGPVMPHGATRLHIAVASPGIPFGCTAALLLPVRITSTTDELTVVSVASGDPVPVVWPGGVAAWRVDGLAELVGPYGNVFGREGDVLDELNGAGWPDGTTHICGLGLGFGGLIEQAPWYLIALSVALGVVIVGVPWAHVRDRRARAAPGGTVTS